MVSAEKPHFPGGYVPHIRHRGRLPAQLIQQEHLFTPTTINDWSQFCRQTMLEYLDGCSERIGCRNKTVEIDDSKFGRRKYSDHSVKVQWVLATLSVSQLKRF